MSGAATLFLLDTNILIHHARGGVVGRRLEADYSLLTTPVVPLISVVTKGEVRAFAAKRNWGAARVAHLDAVVARFVLVDINDRQVIQAYADIDVGSQNQGRRMGKNDLWIAATARVASATLMTTDADFDHLAGSTLAVVRIDSQTGATI